MPHQGLIQLVVGKGVKLRAGVGPVVSVRDADLARDEEGRFRVVSREHENARARALHIGDRLLRFRTNRVRKDDESEKLEVRQDPHELVLRRERALLEGCASDGDNAFPFARSAREGIGKKPGAFRREQRAAVYTVCVMCMFQEKFRGTRKVCYRPLFFENQHPAETACGREVKFVEARVRRAQLSF